MAKHKTPIIMVVFRIILIATAALDIFELPDFSIGIKSAFIIGLVILNLNDYGRNYYQLFEKNRIIYYVSMAISIIVTGLYLIRFDNVPLNLYFIFPIVEIFLYRPKIQIGLLILHVLVFLMGTIVLNAPIQNSLFTYLGMLILIYLFRSISKEKEKGIMLSAELMEANEKLKEITIVKERTRIAQELHDSIGHSLIALKMHLQFTENMIDTEPEKAKEVLAKALGISQTSITDLRKAVDVLKDTKSWKNKFKLRESLVELIQNLQTVGRLQFDFYLDDSVEYANVNIQTVVFETVREAVTNGIKHGNAGSFHIEIFVNDGKVLVKVEDDGTGSGNIIKSHGLTGMEERIHAINGKIQFVSEKGQGFAVEAEIPYVGDSK